MQIDLNETRILPSDLPEIPMGLVQHARYNIKPGGYGKDGLLTQDANGSLFLDGFFTVLNGQYAGETVSQQIGIQGAAPEGFNTALWDAGHSFLRALWDSAKNIQPNDRSDFANMGRRIISFKELDDLQCIVQVGVRLDKQGNLLGLGDIVRPLTPDHALYAEVQQGGKDTFYGFIGESLFISAKTKAGSPPSTPS